MGERGMKANVDSPDVLLQLVVYSVKKNTPLLHLHFTTTQVITIRIPTIILIPIHTITVLIITEIITIIIPFIQVIIPIPIAVIQLKKLNIRKA